MPNKITAESHANLARTINKFLEILLLPYEINDFVYTLQVEQDNKDGKGGTESYYFGTACPVCHLENMADFIASNDIKHIDEQNATENVTPKTETKH